MTAGLVKLPENRVWRNCTGGTRIDRLHGKARQGDSDMPEEQVSSMVEASSPGMEPIAREGMTVVETADDPRFLRDVVDDDQEFYLGAAGRKGGQRLSLLLKTLDSTTQLRVQTHPSTQFANEVMGMPYGKLGCYYTLHTRGGVGPYIRLGFQHMPGRDGWREVMEKQNKAQMDGYFEKIPVQVGEIWYIPSRVPHAVGKGITILEIMEPSDLVVRCEFEREGIVVPENGRFMGQGLDFCLDIFDYTEYSKEETIGECRIESHVLEATDAFRRVRLMDGTLTSCLFMEKLEVSGPALVGHNREFNLGVVCAGSYTMEENGQVIRLKAEDSFLVTAEVKAYQIRPEGSVQMVMVYPGKDMDKLQPRFRLRTESRIVREAFNMGNSARTPDSK